MDMLKYLRALNPGSRENPGEGQDCGVGDKGAILTLSARRHDGPLFQPFEVPVDGSGMLKWL